jgi:hypothetical protein
MSMKSTTIRPPRSRSRIWRAISSAASRLVRVAVSSMSLPRVERAELTSTETSASVWSMTIAPPDGRLTGARERGLDLVLDLEAAEQGGVVLVALDLVRRLRHHVGHELLRLSKMSSVSIRISPTSAVK